MGIKRWFLRLTITVGLVYAATFAFVYGFATTYENPQTPPQAELIICLGGGAYRDGRLAPSSRGRALACADLYRQGAAPKVVFTGANGGDTTISVGQAMADMAIANGVDPAAVLAEGASRSTLQNALFSAPLMGKAQTIILVTDGYHLPRSKVSFQAIGPWDIALWKSTPDVKNPDQAMDWQPLHRETLAIWFNLARYGVWWSATALGLNGIDSWLA